MGDTEEESESNECNKERSGSRVGKYSEIAKAAMIKNALSYVREKQMKEWKFRRKDGEEEIKEMRMPKTTEISKRGVQCGRQI